MRKKEVIEYVFVFYILLIIQNTTIFTQRYVVSFIALLLFVHQLMNKKVKLIVFFLIGYYFFVSYYTHFMFGGHLNLKTMTTKVIILIILPYCTLNYFGDNFWTKFSNIIYILTINSILVFIINVLFYSTFVGFKSYFNFFTAPVFKSNPTFWANGIYTNAVKTGTGLIRNSGFMWEPGYFALICILGIALDWLRNGIRFNRKFVIYSIAIISTMSTAGYFSLFILILAKFIKRFNLFSILLITIFIMLFAKYVYQLSFMGKEINYYRENVIYDIDSSKYNAFHKGANLGRINKFIIDLKRIRINPIGYGYLDSKGIKYMDIYGTNGLSSVVIIWGLPISFYFLFMIKSFFYGRNISNISKLKILLIILSVSITLISNDIEKSPLLFFLIFSPLFYGKSSVQNEH